MLPTDIENADSRDCGIGSFGDVRDQFEAMGSVREVMRKTIGDEQALGRDYDPGDRRVIGYVVLHSSRTAMAGLPRLVVTIVDGHPKERATAAGLPACLWCLGVGIATGCPLGFGLPSR